MAQRAITVDVPKLEAGRDGMRELEEFLRQVKDAINSARRGSFTWNPGSVAATSVLNATFTASDDAEIATLSAGMAVYVTPPSSLDAGLVPTAWVPANGQLAVRLTNVSGAAINPGSGTWLFSAEMV